MLTEHECPWTIHSTCIGMNSNELHNFIGMALPVLQPLQGFDSNAIMYTVGSCYLMGIVLAR